MRIYLPHINYYVQVKFLSGKTVFKAVTKKDSENQCTIFLSKREKNNSPLIAHELVHVLQFICDSRLIDFVHEQEHLGYIMQFLLGRILGYTWK